MKTTELKLEVTHPGDATGVLHRLRNITVKLGHLVRALEIEEVTSHLPSLVIMDGRVGSNTHQQVVGRGILLIDVVDIVGGHQRNAQLLANSHQALIYLLQFRDGVPLYFQVEIAKGLLIPQSRLLRLIKPPLQNELGNLTGNTG